MSFLILQETENLMRLLAVHLAKTGKNLLAGIVGSSQPDVKEEVHYGDWNGGTYYHNIKLHLPEPLYLKTLNDHDRLIRELSEEFSKIYKEENEEVSFELSCSYSRDDNWRKAYTNLVADNTRQLDSNAEDRIWNKGLLKLFLSHKASRKQETAQLQKQLEGYGISAFVAHNDIQVTHEWQTEIENALFSMDAFVALMSDDFPKSDWTDQEVGVAIGRGVPIISVRLGKDPYGFIGKFQGLPGTWDNIPLMAKEVFAILLNHPQTREHLQQYVIELLPKSHDFNESIRIAKSLLSKFESFSEKQLKSIALAITRNDQLYNCGEFCLSLPQILNEKTGQGYEIQDRQLIKKG